MKNKSVFESSNWTTDKKTLAVLIPCRDTLHSAHALSLVEMMKFNTLNNIDTHVFMDASTILLNQREKLATEALNLGADYLLWIDSDIVFPATLALRLMAHNESIVAVNYVKRQMPLKGVAYKKIYDWENPLSFDVQDQLVEVEGIGMGCMLMKTSILTKIKKPWFEFHWHEESNDFLGEDMIFCKKLLRLKEKIKVDTLLSQELRHLGTWGFGPEDLDLD